MNSYSPVNNTCIFHKLEVYSSSIQLKMVQVLLDVTIEHEASAEELKPFRSGRGKGKWKGKGKGKDKDKDAAKRPCFDVTSSMVEEALGGASKEKARTRADQFDVRLAGRHASVWCLGWW